jgi:hypothetical protein
LEIDAPITISGIKEALGRHPDTSWELLQQAVTSPEGGDVCAQFALLALETFNAPTTPMRGVVFFEVRLARSKVPGRAA